MPTEEKPLHQMVEEAYGAFAQEMAAPAAPGPVDNPVAAAFSEIAAQAAPKSPPDKTAEAYASVPSSKALQRFDELEAARGNTADAYAGVQPRTLVSLMNCQSLPPKGMFSALQPSSLPPGHFALLQDVRIDDHSIKARQPTTNRTATGLPGTSASMRGLWSGRLNGTVYVVAAAYDGTKVGIYYSTDGISFSTATATTGAFGDSRLTDTGAPVAFQVVTNKGDALDYLVIQNGTDAPRVFGTATFNGARVRVVKQFSAPTWASSTKALGTCGSLFNTNLSAVTTNGGASHLSAALSGAGSSQVVAITVGTSTASGDWVLLNFGSVGGVSFTQGRQLLFVSDQATMNAWNNWKVEGSADNITWVTLSDPTSSTYYAPTRVPMQASSFTGTAATGGLNGEEIAAFDTTVLTPANVNLLQYIRLTWMSTAPASSFVTTIHGILASGSQLAFQQQYALSYAGLGGMSESAGVVMAGFSSSSCTELPGFSPTVNLPYSAGIYYDHFIPTQVQSLADLKNGCDTINVYRRDAGATDYFFFESYAYGSFSGGIWVFSGSGTQTPPAFTSSITITGALFNATALDVSRYLPDAYATVLPIGKSMASANGRTFVGGLGFYAVSEYGQPFRFRPALQFVNGVPVERSATNVTLSGQTVLAFATPSGSALNSQTVFFWTETKTYAAGGFDGYSLSKPAVCFEIGCSAAGSVAQYKDAIFWLDDNRQIRRFTYGRSFLYGFSNANAYDLAPAISRMVVDDQTNGIPSTYLPFVKGVATFDRYYLFFTPSGQTTNLRALVFEENLQAFVQDSLPVGAQSACAADLSTARTLLLGGSDGGVYTHEDPNSSATHTVRLTTGEISQGMWHPMFFGRVGMVADVQSGQTATVTVSVKPNVSDSSTLDLATSATAQVWRWASRATSTQPGVHGLSAQVDLQLTMTAGTRIYSLAIETTAALPGPDQL